MTEPIRYIVRFPDPKTHYIEVEASLPTDGRQSVEIFLAVWTPGSYLIREYERHMEEVRASGTCVKTRKNRWNLQTNGADRVTFRYRLYCREMSVRTNWVDAGFAFLNGAPTFVSLVGNLQRPHEIRLELPAAWKTLHSGMSEIPGGFFAQDYDTLVDSPILAGNPDVYRFDVDNISHWFVNEGAGQVWDVQRSLADAERIVRQYRSMWGGLPYQSYVFFNLLVEAGGGLEHRNSMCIMASRWATRTGKPYQSWLALLSHEFLHVWNVKRLRPVELGPFDYENENYTRSLWIAEGFTEYYGDLMVKRAGLISEADYLASLSHLLHHLQTTPGRLVQPMGNSSFDAWIKLYRPDENSINSAISYYTKGAVIAWLLDARLRRFTGGMQSLDDLMRLAYSRFAGERGFTAAEFITAAEEIAGADLGDFFHQAVETAEELDYSEALDWFGLRLRGGTPPSVPGKAWLGADTRVDHGRLLVSKIRRGTPAAECGLNVDDEILATGDYRVRADHWAQRLEQYQPGDSVSLLIARRELLLRVEAVLGTEPDKWELELDPQATLQQKRHRDAWL